MIILSLADTKPIMVGTPWGHEKGICYLGKVFVAGQHYYATLQEAVIACRRDLDAGLVSLVIQEAEQYRVWSPLPTAIQTYRPNPDQSKAKVG